MNRPIFANAWARFSEVNAPVSAVDKKIGGKVEQNINSGIFQNACPIRMSYVLNYTGCPIPLKDTQSSAVQTESGVSTARTPMPKLGAKTARSTRLVKPRP